MRFNLLALYVANDGYNNLNHPSFTFFKVYFIKKTRGSITHSCIKVLAF